MKRLLFVPFIVAGSWLAADTVNALLRNTEVSPRSASPLPSKEKPVDEVTIRGFGEGRVESAACPASLEVLSALGVVDRPELALAAIRQDGVIGVVQRGDAIGGLPVESVHVEAGVAAVRLHTSDGLVTCRGARRESTVTAVAMPGVISRDLVDAIIRGDRTDAWAGIRVVPYFEGGTALGFKLYGVKPDSIVASLGVKNGDVIRSVNGYDLHQPGDVFGAYGRFKDDRTFVFDVLRAGKTETLRVDVR